MIIFNYMVLFSCDIYRLHPPLALTTRLTTNEVKVFDNEYTIPADINVVIPIMHIQRNEKYWEHPLEFDPGMFIFYCYCD